MVYSNECLTQWEGNSLDLGIPRKCRVPTAYNSFEINKMQIDLPYCTFNWTPPALSPQQPNLSMAVFMIAWYKYAKFLT